MNDKYCRLVYEYANLQVNRDDVMLGNTIEKKNLHWEELTNDVNLMMEMIASLLKFGYDYNENAKKSKRDLGLDELKKKNEKFWEVAYFHVTQRNLDYVVKDIAKLEEQVERLKKPSMDIWQEIKNSKKVRSEMVTATEMQQLAAKKRDETKEKIKEKKRKFNELAESIDLISHYTESEINDE